IRGRRMERVQKLAEALKKHDSVLTHCNVSGELAMAAAICKAQGKAIKVFATETRPYFQGAKLTCWELQQGGINVTLIADNAVATVISQKMVDAVVFGSDRSCANGDVANKIGTYQIAVVAKEFNIPVYVLTQPSKGIATGKDIPIEIRDENELIKFQGKRIAPKGARGFYPGFDVLPSELITEAIPINVN
ncbi:MAG: S-methyl-5-thioribose-1-phosphate isomerase, partial [Candidatus Omnitrophica bacterium]|nr:S-methyl-5-thioribose-1-phosphate isomerase [Candidatus Omnitrophota bacterium]